MCKANLQGSPAGFARRGWLGRREGEETHFLLVIPPRRDEKTVRKPLRRRGDSIYLWGFLAGLRFIIG